MGVKELLDNNDDIVVTEESVLELEDMSEDLLDAMSAHKLAIVTGITAPTTA